MSKIADRIARESVTANEAKRMASKKGKTLKQHFGTYTTFIGKDGKEYTVSGEGIRMTRYDVESNDYNGYDK